MTHKKKDTRKERREEARARGRKRAGLKPRDKREDPKATARQFRDGKLIAEEGKLIKPTEEEEKPTILLPKPKDDRGIVSKVFGDLPGFRELREEGRLKTGTLPLGISGAVAVGGAIAPKIKVSAEAFRSIQNKLLARQISTKVATFGKGVVGKSVKFVSTTAPAARNFATNAKTISLTKKLLIGAGISLGVVSIAKDILGTYPFASFGKEETLQSISFAMNAAINEGLFEEAQGILDASNEILNAIPTLSEKIPYANVQKEFVRYAEKQKENNVVWQKIIDSKIEGLEGEGDFARERRESDEAATQRKLEQQELDSQYFTLIREGDFEGAEELLQSRIRGEA